MTAGAEKQNRAVCRAIFAMRDDPDLNNADDVEKIMDRSDHTVSRAFILKHPCDSLIYPSAMYPGGKCVAV